MLSVLGKSMVAGNTNSPLSGKAQCKVEADRDLLKLSPIFEIYELSEIILLAGRIYLCQGAEN